MQAESHIMARHDFLADEQATPSTYMDTHIRSIMMAVVFLAPVALAFFLIFALFVLPGGKIT